MTPQSLLKGQPRHDASGATHPHRVGEGRPAEARIASRRGPASAPRTTAVYGDALEQRVELFLATSLIPALRRIQVSLEGDAVVLAGEVRSYYEKQMAAQFASRVAGVSRVVDRIEVKGYVPVSSGRGPDSWRRWNYAGQAG